MSIQEKHKDSIRLFFHGFDINEDDFLEPEEMLSFFQFLNPRIKDGPAFREAIQRIDREGTGSISFEDFAEVADKLFSFEDLGNVSKIHQIFRKMDTGGDGAITREELIHHFREMEGETPSRLMVDRFFELVDMNRDGVVSWPEFLMVAIKNFDFFSDYYNLSNWR